MKSVQWLTTKGKEENIEVRVKVNDTYECSYVEVLEILKYIPREEYEKIPKDYIKFYNENKDKNYKYKYNKNSPKTLRKTDAIIIYLYKNYIASNEEKDRIEKSLKLNSQRAEIEKRKKYNLDNIFKKNKK